MLRYLSGHPAVEVVAASAATKVGARAGAVLPHLGHLDLKFHPVEEVVASEADVLISCVPDGPPDLPSGARVVDLSDRHRGGDAWTYGLPEFFRNEISSASRVANPGCYPTAALLCLVPFAVAGAIEGPIVIDALSGTSGAGRKAHDRLLHGSLDGSVGAYGTVDHRHVPEIERGLTRAAALEAVVSFTPHLVPMSRGVLVTARARLRERIGDAEAIEVLTNAYSGEPFVSVIDEWPLTKSVAGTNNAVVSARVDARAGFLICSAAIDNLGKGAAGQAVQNVNLMFGLEETTGLEATAVWP